MEHGEEKNVGFNSQGCWDITFDDTVGVSWDMEASIGFQKWWIPQNRWFFFSWEIHGHSDEH